MHFKLEKSGARGRKRLRAGVCVLLLVDCVSMTYAACVSALAGPRGAGGPPAPARPPCRKNALWREPLIERILKMSKMTISIGLRFMPTTLDIFACTFLVCSQIRFPESNGSLIIATVLYAIEAVRWIKDYKEDSL